jgi:SNF family Na+-dependent transporter
MPEFAPSSAFELVLFVLTFVVGYSTLLIGYRNAGRLGEWYAVPAFDKTVQTFIVGGIISIFTIVILGGQTVPVDLNSFVAENILRIILIDSLLAWLVGVAILPDYLALKQTKESTC